MWIQNTASTEPLHSIDCSDTERYVALAVTSASLGLGKGNPMWIIMRADKTDGNISCAIQSTLPELFIPR